MNRFVVISLLLPFTGCSEKPDACVEFNAETSNEVVIQIARDLAKDSLWKVENSLPQNREEIPNIGLYDIGDLRVRIVGARGLSGSFPPRATFYADDPTSDSLILVYEEFLRLIENYEAGPVTPCGGKEAIIFFNEHSLNRGNESNEQ